uniref:Uncharacterized protein n=1 Tax=Amphimedon queenslandica TaxID=400682 RepID=A0A1X7VH65_AMPQE
MTVTNLFRRSVWLGHHFTTSVGVDSIAEEPTDSPPFTFDTLLYAFSEHCRPLWDRPAISTAIQRSKPCHSNRSSLPVKSRERNHGVC